MAYVVGGYETGLLDTSLVLLNRNDRTIESDPGANEQIYVNVSNGNLVIQHADAFMPSLGNDYQLIRTYNSRGYPGDAHQHDDDRWFLTTSIRLDVRHDQSGTWFEVEYGDGSVFDYRLDTITGLYRSFDGDGAYETIEDLGVIGNNVPAYLLTRANQDSLAFDRHGRLLSIEDTNGVRTDFVYKSDRLMRIYDDQGHVVNYEYQMGRLARITDETEGVLVQYLYAQGRLVEVVDRRGLSTKYFYTNDGFVNRIELPDSQVTNGQIETFTPRVIQLEYAQVNWSANNRGASEAVTKIIDAEGGETTFEYDFNLASPGQTKGNQKQPPPGQPATGEDKFFLFGMTRMVDPLGNARAHSNAQEYVDWRVANGFYATYDALQEAGDMAYAAQVDLIRQRHALTYHYQENGYIRTVVDQQGYVTEYTYDDEFNLTSVMDRNGWGATHSDSAYFQTLRQDLGFAALVADLTAQEQVDLLGRFTSRFAYDTRGNLLTSTDNEGHVTSFTYTSFNKVASSTSPMGNALVTSDDPDVQDKRQELGYSRTVAGLSQADKNALLALYTTTFEYDAGQNLIRQVDPGGDVTLFEYDSFGNQTRRIVLLDPTVVDPDDPANADKVQITRFLYDGFGNNTQTIDPEGHTSYSQFDHFGNLTTFTDARGGISTFAYDAGNRLLTVSDPEGNTVVNTYDAVGNRISVTDARGQTVTRIFDRNNRLISVFDPSASGLADRTTLRSYDVVGNQTTFTDAEGRVSTFVYDARRQVVETITTTVPGADGTTPTQYSSTYAYDGEGNRIRTTNNRGYTTDVLYTPDGLVRQQTDPNGHIQRVTYDANHNQIQIVAGLQLPAKDRQILTLRYDEEDQTVRETTAVGHARAFSNDVEYQQWRQQNGFYVNYDANLDHSMPAFHTAVQQILDEHSTHFAYDAPGNVIAITDANGNTTDFQYDRTNRVLFEIRPEVIDPVTLLPTRYTVEHRYDPNGNEIETIDENGHSTKFTFDQADRLTMIEDANGIRTVFSYDENSNQTSVRIGVQATADANGHVTITDDQESQTTTFFYDEFNELVRTVDGVGNALATSDLQLYQDLRTQLGYAALVANLSASDQAALRALYTEHYQYDRVGSLRKTTDHEGRVSELVYDGLDRVIEEIGPGPTAPTTKNRYDGNGNLVETIDPLLRSRTFQYDEVDRQTDGTDPLGVVEHREYDDFGNLTAQTAAFGTADARRTEFRYDLDNRLVESTDPELHSQKFEYDAVGNRIRAVDGKGGATEYRYDALNRRITVVDPMTFQAKFEYDGVGNQITLIDARSNETRFRYDPGNRLIETTDAENRVSTFQYDVRGNVTIQTTGAGAAGPGSKGAEVTTFVFDAEGNLRSSTDAEGNTVSQGFDRVYNLTSSTDGNGKTTGYAYDALNRLTTYTDALGKQTTFQYDVVSNLLTETDANGHATTYQYDANDRLMVVTDANLVETHFQYDAVGNRTSITRAKGTADESTQTFGYYLDDLLMEQADGLGHKTTFQYDANHNQTVVVDPEGHATIYRYDANNRVTEIEDALGAKTKFSYDQNGNRTQVTNALGFTATSYYDAENEVVLTVDAEGYATSFEYDVNGNIAAQTTHMTALPLPVDPNVLPAVAPSAADQRVELEYDKLNRVTKRISGEGYETHFVYDAVGNRIATHQQVQVAGLGPVTTVTGLSIGQVAGLATATVTAGHGFRTGDLVSISGANEAPYNGQFTVTVVDGQTFTFAIDPAAPATATGAIQASVALRVATTHSFYDDVNREIARVSAEGHLQVFEYDFVGNVKRQLVYEQAVTLPANGLPPSPQPGDVPRETRFEYDVVDRLDAETRTISATPGDEVRTAYEYDARGNQTAVTRAVGKPEATRSEYHYDLADRRERVVDGLAGDGSVTPETVETRFEFDDDGNVQVRHDAFGRPEQRTTTFLYDAVHRVTQITDARGVVTKFTYDAAGNQKTQTLAFGRPEQRVETFDYDHNNRQVAATNGENERTEYRYDGAGNQTHVILGVGSAVERTNVYEYDRDDRLTALIDGRSTRTEYRYDGANNRVEATQNVGVVGEEKTTRYAWDLLDRLVAVQDPEGGRTFYAYDAVGNQTQKIDANAHAVTTTFDHLGRAQVTIDGAGTKEANSWDQLGNRLTQTISFTDGSDARTTQFEYDRLGRLTLLTDGEGFSTRYQYNAYGNQTSVETGLYLPVSGDPGYDASKAARERTIATGYQYDAQGNLTDVTDGLGNVIHYSYDGVGNRLTETFAFGSSDTTPRTTTYQYDLANRITRIEGAEGSIRVTQYDEVGNVSLTRALQSGVEGMPSAVWITETFGYDGNGNRTLAIDGNNNRTTFEYDRSNNLTVRKVAEGTADERVTTRHYDLNNDKVSETDAENHTTLFFYDARGNQIRVQDALGRSGRYYYDGANRLRFILDAEGYVNEFRYDSAGNRTHAIVYMTKYAGPIDDLVPPVVAPDPGDRVVTTMYDGAHNIERIGNADGSAIDYVTSSSGAVLTRTEVPTTAEPNRVQRFDYDLAGRLVQFTDVDGLNTFFTYDDANNKKTETLVDTTYPLLHPNRLRTTTYDYDLENRLIRETNDPTGLSIVQELRYDKIGNVVEKVDPNHVIVRSAYDLNNNLLNVTVDPGGLALKTMFEYDGANNQKAVIDANGGRTDVTYDKNDRIVKEELPAVLTYTTAAGFQTLRPTKSTQYDAVGNVVQVTDETGARTTHYYNANNQIVAVIRGDNALVEFDYDAANQLVAERLYMNRVAATAHDDLVNRPTGTGEIRETRRDYDLGGRLVRVILPQIEVTSVDYTDPNAPVATTSSFRPQEIVVYNGFGEAVETFDHNAIGNKPISSFPNTSTLGRARELTYYDPKGRVVAFLDAEGYLTEWDYDGQGNVVEQRTYTTQLDMTTASKDVKPVGVGTPLVVNRTWDAVNRLKSELSPSYDVTSLNASDPTLSTTSAARVLTTYTYDDAGNRLTRTRAAGTSLATTEYEYYDAANRRVGLVNGERVLHQFAYNANGQLTIQKRLASPLLGSVSPSSLTAADVQLGANLTPILNGPVTTVDDQGIEYTYDGAGRLTRERDLTGFVFDSSDPTRFRSYNARGNVTRQIDEGGFITEIAYDGIGRILQNVSANGNGSIIEYDAAGNAILQYAGNVTNTILPAAPDANVTFGDNDTSSTSDDYVEIGWTLGGGAKAKSYLVYDTSSHATASGTDPATVYAYKSAEQATWDSAIGSVRLQRNPGGSLPTLTAGTRIYYRVVSVDLAGNQAWGEEQSFLVPPRLSNVAVTRSGSNGMRVQVAFESGVSSPVLRISSGQSASMTNVGGNTWAATVSGLTNIAARTFRIEWQDADGNLHSSETAVPFRAQGLHTGSQFSLDEQPDGAGDFKVVVTATVPNGAYDFLEARWRESGSGAVYSTSSLIAPGNTIKVGGGLESGKTYEVVMLGHKNGVAIVLDTFDVAPNTSTIDGRVERSLSWDVPEVGDDPDIGSAQLVLIDGVRVMDPNVTRSTVGDETRLLVDTSVTPSSSFDFDVFYGNLTGTNHNVTVTRDTITTAVDGAPPAGDLDYRVDAYELSINATNAPAGTKVAWRPAGTGASFSNEVNLGTAFQVIPPGNPAQSFDIKVYYVDAAGHEVIIDFTRVTVGGFSIGTVLESDPADLLILSHTTESLHVTASETGATGSLSGGSIFSLTAGLYQGALSDETVRTDLSLPVTSNAGLPGGTLDTNGLATGYFIESEFNALNHKVATNEGDGLWRRFGVDANGNAVHTKLFGTKQAEIGNLSSIDTFTEFDARNYEVAEFGALANVVIDNAGTTANRRAVTRWTRDYEDRIVTEQAPLGTTKTTAFNALGLVVSEVVRNSTNTIVSQASHDYDALGNRVATSDGAHTRYTQYAINKRVAEWDAKGIKTSFVNDTFGRAKAVNEPGPHNLGGTTTTSMTYDQRDHLKQVVDGQGGTTSYNYDSRGNRIEMIDANGHRFYQQYDELGRVVITAAHQNGTIVGEARQYDFYNNVVTRTTNEAFTGSAGNLQAVHDGSERTRTFTFGGFARKLQETDESGRVTDFLYDRFGRLFDEQMVDNVATSRDGTVIDLAEKHIDRTYDAAGRLLTVTDHTTGTTTTFQYDVAGNRKVENVTAPGTANDRMVRYEYDQQGQLTRWRELTGAIAADLHYEYDGQGNLTRVHGTGPAGFSVDNKYEFDANDRVRFIKDGNNGDAILATFVYDQVGNRQSHDDGAAVTTYNYDRNHRVTSSSGGATQSWSYDPVGNVTSFNDNGKVTNYSYHENNLNWKIDNTADKQVTTLVFDRSSRTLETHLSTVVTEDDEEVTKNFTFIHYATPDGRETKVAASGNASGGSTSTFDANDNLIAINLGKGDTQASAAQNFFEYNNEDEIIYRKRLTGETADSVPEGETPKLDNETEYFFSNRNPVGEYGNSETDGTKHAVFNTGRYNLVQTIGEDFPSNSVRSELAFNGDTLRSIADRVYGNASLWFVLAEANGLTGNEVLKEGQRVQVPNTVQTGRLTAQTHLVYEEGDVIGATLPNLLSPPPEEDGCATFLAIVLIVLIVIVAVVVAVVTVGVATPIATAVASLGIGAVATTLLTVAAVAVVGAAIAFVGAVITQGLLIAFGVQEEFDWKAVAAETVAGAFSGAAAGIGAAAAAAGTISKLAKVGFTVASAAVAAGGEALRQVITDGKVTSWVGVAGAGVAAGIATAGSFAKASQTAAEKALEKATKVGDAVDDATAVLRAAKASVAKIELVEAVAGIVTEWAKVAEKAIRGKEITTADWLSAAAGTVAGAVTIGFTLKGLRALGNDVGDAAGQASKAAGEANKPNFFVSLFGEGEKATEKATRALTEIPFRFAVRLAAAAASSKGLRNFGDVALAALGTVAETAAQTKIGKKITEIAGTVKTATGIATKVIGGKVGAFLETVGEIAGVVQGFGRTVAQGIKSLRKTKEPDFAGEISGTIKTVVSYAEKGLKAVQTAVKKITEFSKGASGFLGKVGRKLQEVKIGEKFVAGVKKVGDFLGKLSEYVGPIIGKVSEFSKTVTKAIEAASTRKILNKVGKVLAETADSFVAELGAVRDQITKTAQQVQSKLTTSAFGKAVAKAADAVSAFPQAAANAVARNRALKGIGDVVGAVQRSAKTAAQAVAGSRVVALLKKGFDTEAAADALRSEVRSRAVNFAFTAATAIFSPRDALELLATRGFGATETGLGIQREVNGQTQIHSGRRKLLDDLLNPPAPSAPIVSTIRLPIGTPPPAVMNPGATSTADFVYLANVVGRDGAALIRPASTPEPKADGFSIGTPLGADAVAFLLGVAGTPLGLDSVATSA